MTWSEGKLVDSSQTNLTSAPHELSNNNGVQLKYYTNLDNKTIKKAQMSDGI